MDIPHYTLYDVHIQNDLEVPNVNYQPYNFLYCGVCALMRYDCPNYIVFGYDCHGIRVADSGLTFEVAPYSDNKHKFPVGKCRCSIPCNCKKPICCCIL